MDIANNLNLCAQGSRFRLTFGIIILIGLNIIICNNAKFDFRLLFLFKHKEIFPCVG